MNENPVQETGNGQEAVKGGFFSSLIDIFLDPSKVFKRIDAGLQWWKAFIVLAVANAAITWYGLPLQRQLASLNPRGLTDDQLARQLEQIDSFGWIGVVAAPIMVLVVIMIVAGFVNMMVNLVSARSDFKKTLSLICFTGIIGLLEQVISIVIIHLRGIETFESRADAVVSLGPGALFPESEGLLSAVMQALSIFQIWYYIIFVLGLAFIFRMSWKKALVPAILLWAISVGLIMVGQMFSGA